MPTGATWKERREALGKTLDEAAAELRINRRYLEGIEEGDFGKWPERVFSSGFIRSYAKYLSVDPEPVLTEYFRGLDAQSTPEPLLQVKPEWLEREKARGTRRANYVAAAGVVLLIGIVLGWYSLRTPTRPLPPPESVPSPKASSLPSAAADNAGTAAGAAAPGDNASAAAATDNAAPPAPTVSAVGGGGPVTVPFQLFLEAREMTWMLYSFDDSEPVEVMLYPGDKLSIQSRTRIVLKLGNAGGVAGTLNGKPLSPFGGRGEVKEVRFGE